MPKEIRNPKSEWRDTLEEVEREGSAFWIWGEGWLDVEEINPMAENRNPNEVRNPKSETGVWINSASGLGFRVAFGFRPSDFGF
jgi:hypothetical protein